MFNMSDILETNLELVNKPVSNVKKVFLDNRLKKYVVPTEMRDNSITPDGIRYTSGTVLPLNFKDNKYIRLFSAWGVKSDTLSPNALKDKHQNFDLDLSAGFLDKEFNFSEISFYNQHNDISSHSGDWTSCGVWNKEYVTAEYIDVDIEAAIQNNMQYIIGMNIYFNFNEENWNNKVHAETGIMLLNERLSNLQWIDISNNLWSVILNTTKQTNVPVLIDLVNQELIILDIYQDSDGRCISNYVENINNLKSKYVNCLKYKENMFDFLSLYCNANNIEIVSNIEDAELYISYEDHETLKTFNVGKNLDKILNLLSK